MDGAFVWIVPWLVLKSRREQELDSHEVGGSCVDVLYLSGRNGRERDVR